MWLFHSLCCGQEGMHLCFICWFGNIPSHHFIFLPQRSVFSRCRRRAPIEKHCFLSVWWTSVNSGIKKGLISLIKETLWVGFVWFFAHRLELALKQVLKEWFEPITTCLLNLYYLYEKSSKKLRELKVLCELLKEIYKFKDNQAKSHHATGTRWIVRKLEALHNMINMGYTCSILKI